jgi:hypothetical protein
MSRDGRAIRDSVVDHARRGVLVNARHPLAPGDGREPGRLSATGRRLLGNRYRAGGLGCGALENGGQLRSNRSRKRSNGLVAVPVRCRARTASSKFVLSLKRTTSAKNQVKPRLRGQAALVRYDDDFVMVFQTEEDARRVAAVLPKRFEKYGLRLHPEKTRLVCFKRPERDRPPKRLIRARLSGPGSGVGGQRTRKERVEQGSEEGKPRPRFP